MIWGKSGETDGGLCCVGPAFRICGDLEQAFVRPLFRKTGRVGFDWQIYFDLGEAARLLRIRLVMIVQSEPWM